MPPGHGPPGTLIALHPLTFTGKGLQLIWQPGSALCRPSGQSPPPQYAGSKLQLVWSAPAPCSRRLADPTSAAAARPEAPAATAWSAAIPSAEVLPPLRKTRAATAGPKRRRVASAHSASALILRTTPKARGMFALSSAWLPDGGKDRGSGAIAASAPMYGAHVASLQLAHLRLSSSTSEVFNALQLTRHGPLKPP